MSDKYDVQSPRKCTEPELSATELLLRQIQYPSPVPRDDLSEKVQDSKPANISSPELPETSRAVYSYMQSALELNNRALTAGSFNSK